MLVIVSKEIKQNTMISMKSNVFLYMDRRLGRQTGHKSSG